MTFDLSLGMKPVTIEVEKGAVFSGHVYDPDGNPVFGATVAPALTGSGNSLTGDTRYSVKTASDGSYRVVMPAGNSVTYNLVAHDGTYNRWRKWANGVSEPVKSSPNQRFENFDFKLTRGVWISGRVTDKATGEAVVPARLAYIPSQKNSLDAGLPEFKRNTFSIWDLGGTTGRKNKTRCVLLHQNFRKSGTLALQWSSFRQ